MNLEILILFALSTIGMAHIIVDGSIMEWFRKLVKYLGGKIDLGVVILGKKLGKEWTGPHLGGVVDCYLCAGTWCGFVMGWAWVSHYPLQVFACGCAGGFLANLAAVILNWIEASTIVNLPEDKNGH